MKSLVDALRKSELEIIENELKSTKKRKSEGSHSDSIRKKEHHSKDSLLSPPRISAATTLFSPSTTPTTTSITTSITTSEGGGSVMPAPTSKWPNFKLTKAQSYLVNVIDDADKTSVSSSKIDPLQLNPNPNAAQSAREIFMAKLKAQAGGIALFPKGNMYVSKGNVLSFTRTYINSYIHFFSHIRLHASVRTL